MGLPQKSVGMVVWAGYFTDVHENMYSFQFTLINPHIFGLEPYIIMLALTDFKTGKHYYS